MYASIVACEKCCVKKSIKKTKFHVFQNDITYYFTQERIVKTAASVYKCICSKIKQHYINQKQNKKHKQNY